MNDINLVNNTKDLGGHCNRFSKVFFAPIQKGIGYCYEELLERIAPA